MQEKGIFTISLDFELYWGMRDVVSIQDYEQNLEGIPQAVEKMLTVFKRYDIAATWATIGFLFYKDADDLQKHMPTIQPQYENEELNLYQYLKNTPDMHTPYHFAISLLQDIAASENQEIATHTFSHYYCLEKGQSLKEFDVDIQASIEVAKSRLNQETKSLVFPRNQWNESYLKTLEKYEILSYRGNEKSWIYKVVDADKIRHLRRALKLVDTYINISGHNTYTLHEMRKKRPFNIPASKFLRPVSKKLGFLENLRLQRIKNSMTHAAKHGELFHLWWHPHNFGVDTHANIIFLEEIGKHFQHLQEQYGMRSLTMKAVSTLLEESTDA